MFYSHDLLGRKSPLGAIWTMAHGKKLSKFKILGINVKDVCDQILQPDVPHSLRLQGILIGGVVIVFNKQQIYLMEDLQEMARRVRAASVPEAAAAAAVHTMLQKGKDKARVEAITLADIDADLDMDMEQLLMMDANRLNRQPLTAANDPQRPRRGKAAKPGDNGVDAVDGEEAAGGGKGRAKGGQTPAAALYGVPDDPNLADFDLGGDAFGLEFTAFAARPGGGGGGAAGGGGGGDGFLGATEDLFVVPTLGPYGDTQDASLGALRNSSRGGASGSGLPGSLLVRSGTGTGTGTGAAATGAAHTSTLAMDDAMDPEDLFEAPDLGMLLRGAGLAADGDEDGDEDDRGQEAFLLALGGFGRRGRGAAATGTGTAATDGTGRLTKDTTVDGAAAATGTTATGTTDGGGGGKSRATDGGYNANANATTMLMFDMPTDLFGVPEAGEGTQEELQQLRRRRQQQQQQQRKQDLADDGTFLDNDDEEDDDGDEQQQQQQQQQQRSTSVVSLPLPSVGLPPEHDMPPSPLAEGFGAAQHKRRRNSDDENDSAGVPYDNANANARLGGGAAPEASLSDQQLEAEAGGEGVEQEAGAGKKAGGRRTANARRADGDAANNRAGRKGARRRTGGKVTLDEQQDIQIRGSVYREWTLDPRPITKPAAKRHHHLLHTLAAPTPGTQLTGPSQTQGQQQPFAFLAGTPYSQSQAHVAFAAAAGAAGAPQQGANGPMGHLNGLYQQRLTVGAPLGAAVAAALAAGDVDKAAAAALRGPAAAVGGMGLTGWCEELEAVVERAAAPMAAQAAAEAEDAADGERVKRRRRGELPLVPAPGGAVDGGQPGGGGMAPLPLRRARSDTATASEAEAEGEQLAEEDEYEQPLLDNMMLVEEDEEGAFGGAVARGLVNPFKQPQLQQQQMLGGRARAGTNASMRSGGTEQEQQQGTDLFAEGEELAPMDEDVMTGLDGIEYERLRRGDHTPAGAREALGLSPGGSGSGLGLGALGGANGPMGRRGSRATGGTTGTTASGSSLGRESEDGGTAQGGLGRRGGARSGSGLDGSGLRPLAGALRWGSGALEDLLPAISEGEGRLGAGEELWDMEEQPDAEAAAAAATDTGVDGTEGGSRSRRRGTANANPASGTATGTATGTGTGTGSGSLGGLGTLANFQLVETCGGPTQLPGAPNGAYASKHTRTVMAIYRRQLASAVERAAAATAAAAGPSTSAAAAAAPPPSGGAASVSFFDLAARLRRPEAVKLFYQTLVSHTLGVVRARQDEPYGDLTITVGRYF